MCQNGPEIQIMVFYSISKVLVFEFLRTSLNCRRRSSLRANFFKANACTCAISAETKKETPVTAGGGTPDTQNADKESERLGKNRMRQAGY